MAFPTAVDLTTHEGTGEAIDQAQKAAAANAGLSNTQAKGPSGASGSGKRAQAGAWKADQARKAGFLDKLGKASGVIDLVSTAAKAAGHLVEGDSVGAGAVIVDDLVKKGTAAVGAVIGTAATGSPVGAVVGAGAFEELHNATTGKLITAAETAITTQKAQDAMLGFAQTGRYTGQLNWTYNPPAQEGAMQPPMTIQYTGPVTADLDKDGNLKMHYDLKGGMPGLVAGATAGIGMSLQMSATADLTGTAKEGTFTAEGISKGTTKFNVDYGGAQGAPENQSQSNSGSGPIKASGTYTRETMTGTFTSPGGGPPIHVRAHQDAVIPFTAAGGTRTPGASPAGSPGPPTG